ncbi:MAG: hypothetical protein OXU33_05595, partial [Gemmatimonadota bacterium]|nr:hypothetical protein [Gemmatimonadota bacterium]
MSGSTKAVALACALGLAACDAFMPSAPLDEDVLAGTIEGMTASQVGQHIAGDEEFGRVFAVA